MLESHALGQDESRITLECYGAKMCPVCISKAYMYAMKELSPVTAGVVVQMAFEEFEMEQDMAGQTVTAC